MNSADAETKAHSEGLRSTASHKLNPVENHSFPLPDLLGKTAVITGASKGIGAAMARTLGRCGALVVVHYAQTPEGAEAVVQDIQAAGGQAFAVQADLREQPAIARMFATLDSEFTKRCGSAGMDILVNNAGAGGPNAWPEVTEGEFDAINDLLFKATFFVTQHAAKRLNDHGRVVNISSCATRSAQPNDMVYAAAKAAVNYLTLGFAKALGPRGITVNALSPGATATDLIAHLRAHPGFDQAAARNTALGRLGQPQDIADALLLLLSPQAHWITGNVIDVSGGLGL